MALHFNDKQLDRLSEIFGNVGLVFLAAIVLPILMGQTSVNASVLLSGVTLTLGSIMASLLLLKGGVA